MKPLYANKQSKQNVSTLINYLIALCQFLVCTYVVIVYLLVAAEQLRLVKAAAAAEEKRRCDEGSSCNIAYSHL